MKKSRSKLKPFSNVFEDIGFSPEESRALAIKAQLAALLVRKIRDRKLTQKELGKLWGVPQPRVSEIMTGKLSLVSIERLIEFLGTLGVEVVIRAKNSSSSKKAG